MNKREFEKAARNITWRVCMLGEFPTESPELAELDAAVRAAGYMPTRENIAGFDGVRFEGNGRAVYCAAPRTRKPGKKQTCTMYSLEDVRAFEEADAALCAGDYARADNIASTIGAASLRNELREGLERLEMELGLENIAAAMEQAADPDPVDELEQVRALLGRPHDVEVTQKRPGCCIWVSGNTRPLKENLKGYGFRWAPKRQAWYWKPAA